MIYHIYTDGSCDNSKIPEFRSGGWAFVVKTKTGKYVESDGVSSHTTSQRMELTAAFKAMEYMLKVELSEEDTILIYCDSAYTVNIFRQNWYRKWDLEGYGFLVNETLLKEIVELYKSLRGVVKKLEFIKVSGHKGVVLNEFVDKLSREQRIKHTQLYEST